VCLNIVTINRHFLNSLPLIKPHIISCAHSLTSPSSNFITFWSLVVIKSHISLKLNLISSAPFSHPQQGWQGPWQLGVGAPSLQSPTSSKSGYSCTKVKKQGKEMQAFLLSSAGGLISHQWASRQGHSSPTHIPKSHLALTSCSITTSSSLLQLGPEWQNISSPPTSMSSSKTPSQACSLFSGPTGSVPAAPSASFPHHLPSQV
jgi:hypothetical protein